MSNRENKEKTPGNPGLSRRAFLELSAAIAAGAAAANLVWINSTTAAVPASGGYLLVDVKKCQGCMSCMLACSLVHEGAGSFSLSRIQVIQNSFGNWPDDLTIEQCRQCVKPACVNACPAGALTVDASHGNVRRIEEDKCIGCRSCINACPYTPGRITWDPRDKHAGKCDLCAAAPFWKEKGGPGGKQACIEVCPVRAIAFTREIPVQTGESGYKVDLRGSAWGKLGYPED